MSKNADLLENFELIKQGAEAKLYTGTLDGKLVIAKERFKKSYRLPELDKSLTSRRIKNEVKLLTKASTIGVSVPKVIKSDTNYGIIFMEYFNDSITLREFFINLAKSEGNLERKNEILMKISIKIGQNIGKLHKNQIIHGDLTTSNMLIKANDTDINESSIHFIDFGLSSISSQQEEKAVDLYVLERALQSTHSKESSKIFKNIMKGYSDEYGANVNQVIERLNQVRLRGRKRSMIG